MRQIENQSRRTDRTARKSNRLLATAVSASVAGFASTEGDASLLMDVRAVPGAGYTVLNDLGAGKHVGDATYGTVVSLQLFGRVSGTDGMNNEKLKVLGGSVASSVGGLLGNLTHQIAYATGTGFAGSSSQNGVQNDFDSDGDLDVGSVGTATAGKIVYRSNASTFMNASGNATAIDANTAEVLLGTLTFTLTGGAGTTVVQVIPRPGNAAGVASWNEDAVLTAKVVTTGTFGAVSPGVLIGLSPAGSDLYWDASGTTGGAGGPTPTGTWGTDAFWNTDSGGTDVTSTWTQGAAAHFAAGNDASGSYTVTVAGSQTANGLVFEEGSVTLSGGTVAVLNGVVQVLSSGGATIGSNLISAAGLIKSGTGTLTLAGANSYTGGTTIQAGMLRVSADNNLGDAGGAITVGAGTLATTAGFSTARAISLASGSAIDVAASTTVTASGLISGAGALTKSGGGTLVLSGANPYAGGTTINAGRIAVAANGKLGSGPLTLDGGGVRLDAAFDFDSSSTTVLGPSGGTVDTQGFDVNFIQPVTGSGGLTKAGSGKLTLLSAASFGGATTISSGILSVGSTLSSSVLDNSGQLAVIAGTISFTGESSSNPGAKIDAVGSTLNFGSGVNLLLNAGWINLIDSTVNGDIDSLSMGVINSAGDVTFNGNITGGGMIEVASGMSALAAGGNKVIAVATVSIDGKLDLTDNRMIVRSTPIGSWNGSSYTGVTGLVAAGRGDGTWSADADAVGITTSMTDVLTGPGYTSLGVARASEALNIAPNDAAVWGGQLVSGTDTLIKYTYGGDANLSGSVDVDDYGQIDFNANLGGLLPGWFNGDFDYSGIVDIDDYGIIDFAITAQGPPLLTSGGASFTVASVPEPTGGLLAATAAAIGVVRRRTRR